jgi:hypothetical protein
VSSPSERLSFSSFHRPCLHFNIIRNSEIRNGVCSSMRQSNRIFHQWHCPLRSLLTIVLIWMLELVISSDRKKVILTLSRATSNPTYSEHSLLFRDSNSITSVSLAGRVNFGEADWTKAYLFLLRPILLFQRATQLRVPMQDSLWVESFSEIV